MIYETKSLSGPIVVIYYSEWTLGLKHGWAEHGLPSHQAVAWLVKNIYQSLVVN